MLSTDQYSRALSGTDSNESSTLLKQNVQKRIRKISSRLQSHGVHSSLVMTTAGFRYIGKNDTVRCDTCQLEVSEWTKTMIPFSIHAERSPECEFIRSRLQKHSLKSDNEENRAKRQKTESNSNHIFRLIEVKTLKEIRRRTFSHWSHRTKPSAEQMIVAGFFSCNVGDRVICLYCNLICQQWSSDTDDPSEVHKILSSQCPYVLSMLTYPNLSSTLILNEISSNNMDIQAHGLTNTTHFRFDQLVHTTPCHPLFSSITKRLETFMTTWSQESMPSVEELARSGFFYTGINNVVTCFYCNGSLQNWGANDNPMIEHARWFPHCPYAKQLCGDELYHKIQESKRAQQERNRISQSRGTNQTTSNHRQLQINDANMLPRVVASRLDLSMSQNLLDQYFKLSVIKRCWEDQFQLKRDDFATDSDLFMACTILQKQIDYIQGNKDNIIIPSVRMKLIRDGLSSTSANNIELMQTQSTPTSAIESENTAITKAKSEESETVPEKNVSLYNPCIICNQAEKRLACIPCGHFTSCVPCGQSIRTCPTCRREIEAFVRIYI